MNYLLKNDFILKDDFLKKSIKLKDKQMIKYAFDLGASFNLEFLKNLLDNENLEILNYIFEKSNFLNEILVEDILNYCFKNKKLKVFKFFLAKKNYLEIFKFEFLNNLDISKDLYIVELLKNRLNKKINMPIDLKTGLYYSVKNNYFFLTKFLIENHLSDLDYIDEKKNSLLHIALKNESYEIAEFLLINTKKIHYKNENLDKETILHISSKKGCKKLFPELFYNFFNDKKNKEGKTPFFYTLINCSLNLIKLFTEKNISFLNINLENKKRPIHLMAKNGRFEIIKFLIEKKVEINVKDEFGNYPLHYGYKFEKIKKILILNGANEKLKNNSGKTPKEFNKNFFENAFDKVKKLFK